MRLLLELRVGQSLPTQPPRLGGLLFAGAGLRGVNAQNTFEPAAEQFGERDLPAGAQLTGTLENVIRKPALRPSHSVRLPTRLEPSIRLQR